MAACETEQVTNEPLGAGIQVTPVGSSGAPTASADATTPAAGNAAVGTTTPVAGSPVGATGGASSPVAGGATTPAPSDPTGATPATPATPAGGSTLDGASAAAGQDGSTTEPGGTVTAPDSSAMPMAGMAAAPEPQPEVPAGPDLSGTWYTTIESLATQNLPLLGEGDANVSLVMRVVVEGTAPEQTATYEICALHTESTPDPSASQITFGAPVLATLHTTVPADLSGVMVGGEVPLPMLTLKSGVDATGAREDTDGDGNPGVTIPATVLGGSIKVNAYVELTIEAAVSGTLMDPDTIVGSAQFSATGAVIASDNPLITAGSISVIPKEATQITAKRMPGNVDCAGVLAAQ